MATSRSKEVSFVEDGTLQLDVGAGCRPDYTGIVVIADVLLVICDRKLQLHSRHDGKLLAVTDQLESIPKGMCLISNKKVAVFLDEFTIEILSFESTHRIERVNRFHVRTGFSDCFSVAKFNSGKLIVSGEKLEQGWMLYWCVVDLTDGRVDSTHKVCRGDYSSDSSHMAIKNDTVYISYEAHKPSDTGVYSYHIPNPKRRKFLYHHSDLKYPRGLFVDTRDYIYVCNDSYPYSIHQLTERGELVTIHTLSSRPFEIFYDEQDGVMYMTHGYESNKITRYRLDHPHQQGVPIEILNMDERSIQLFKEALKDGKETVYHIRVMVVGHKGVGKTTLIKRLLGEEVNISERHSTEGIDVYINCYNVSLSTLEWTRRKKHSEQDDRLRRVVRVLNEQQSATGMADDNDQVAILPQGETTDSNASVTDEEQVIIIPHVETNDSNASDNNGTELPNHRSPQEDHAQNLSASGSQLEELPSATSRRKLTQAEANTIPMLQLLKKNADKLKQHTVENAKLTIWDFAGQYAFYTTHQTFLTQRAIYLLVSDVSEQVTDLVADVCYFDSKGITRCKVHELTEVWLNSIHSCAEYPKSRTPPVILVGTHVDKIIQKQSSAKLVSLERQSTLPSAPTNADSAMGDEPMTLTDFGSQQDSFEPPIKQRRIEPTTVSSMTGDNTIPSDDQFKKQTISRLPSGIEQKIVQTDVIAFPSTEIPVEEITVGEDAGKASHDEICKGYFREIRSYLKGKPIRYHLIDENFAIDNTVVDKRLEDLKRKIVEVASQQPYWGEEIPARWIILEQELMTQRAAGVKVISLEEVKKLNKKGTVQIEKSEEIDLFLRYLHEIGIIIYFSVEVLRDNILLDPIWLIDALKSLINAQPSLPESSADNGSQSTSRTDNGTQSTTPDDSGSQSTSLTDNDTQSTISTENGSLSTNLTDQYAQSATPDDSGSQSTSLTDNDSLSTTPAENGLQSTTPDGSGSQSTSLTDNDTQSTTPADNGSQSTSLTDIDSQSTTPADSGSQSISHTGHTVAQRWSDFKEKGELHLELVDAVWTLEKHPEFHIHKDKILLIMEQLNIIAKPRSFSEIGEKVENYFLTPCMLRQESPKEVIYPSRDRRIESTPVLQYIFRGKFLPSPIFHRLLAACVAHWPVAKKKETSENLIFCGCCVFDLDLFHRLTLCFKNHVISARITRMAIDEVKIPDAKLCSRVRRFITLNLSKITSYLGQNLQYDLHLTCPPSQMWLADEVHDPDVPITSEHMNHARLCVALVTICGKALRDILLTQVPDPHKDIYQALLAKKAELTTRKGHFTLNQDQIQLVFPGYQSQKTGRVDQFDLSLLYTLIRNVSTVTPPLTGWGKDPQPSDTSLGASVERIHSYRNHISGHSPDGKISLQDLEDYWNKLRSILEDIEKALGTQVYRAQLEKQKSQVISVYEAC